MKKIIWTALAVLLLVGCRDEQIPGLTDPDDLSNRVFQVTATVGEENNEPGTRVTLTPDGMGMSLAWEVGDPIELLFRQTLPGQETTRVKTTTTIKSITSNGKRGTFDIVVPTEINLDSPFDLYGVYGGGGLDDTNLNRAIFPVNIGGTLDKVEEQREVMLVFRKTNITDMSQPLTVNFQHIGHLFCLKLKNDGTETLHLNSVYLIAKADNAGYKKWVMSGTGNYYDVETQQYSSGTARTDTLAFAMPVSGIAPGDSCMLYAWCRAVNSEAVEYKNQSGVWITRYEVPKLRLAIVRPSGNKWFTSVTTPRKESAPSVGRCFHFVASVTNTAVYFDFANFSKPNTTMTGLKLKGDLLYAFGSREGWSSAVKKDITLPSVIGVLYSRADSLFYNEASDGTGISINNPYYKNPDRYEANWGTEVFLGKGLTEVCAVDGCYYGDVYIAYVTPEGKIGWRSKPNRTLSWGEEILIESQGGGVCSKPDIVRAEGRNPRTFIVYTDSHAWAGPDKYAKGIMAYGYNQTECLFIEKRTERPEGGYIEERYPQGARTTAGRTSYYSGDFEVDVFFLNPMTLRERITVSSEEVVESTEYDIIITTGRYDSSPATVASYTIPVSSSDHILDITSGHLGYVSFAAAYTKNNVLQITYFQTYFQVSYTHLPSTLGLLTRYEDALPSVQLSNTSENPAFLSYVPSEACTGLAGIDASGNLINVSSHFTWGDPSYIKGDQFIHNTSKQVKPGTVATSVDFANTHIYSVYTDIDGYIRIEYIDSSNRENWQ